MARIIDVGIQNNDLDYIIRVGIMLVISAIMSLIFGVLSGRFAALASSGFAKNLRQGMFYSIQNYSFSNIDKIFYIKFSNKTNNRCNKCPKCFSNDNKSTSKRSSNDSICLNNGIFY